MVESVIINKYYSVILFYIINYKFYFLIKIQKI